MLDGWFVPMDYILPESQSTFFDSVAANNQTVMDAINAIITAGQIKVTYIPGNHDLLLTEADLERILPGINQERDDVQGLGKYITGKNSEIVIEHGHRYNFFCAPDQISNRDITNNNSSILPPGYFFTRIATSSVVEGFPKSSNTFPDVTADKNNASQYGYYVYNLTWKGVLSNLPVNESFSDKAIKTNIDGYTQDYAINDLIPHQNPTDGLIDVNLYKGVQDTWDERQALNGVNVKIPVDEAIAKANDYDFTDAQAKIQYFDKDASKRIVVFGHTHGACILTDTNLTDEKTIYANSGTWIDNAQGYPTMTFIVIIPPQSGSAIEIVNLYKYSLDDTITQWGEAQAITN
ncbi:MAG: metallophosphoesterase [Nitrososphaeraceae archaeon]